MPTQRVEHLCTQQVLRGGGRGGGGGGSPHW